MKFEIDENGCLVKAIEENGDAVAIIPDGVVIIGVEAFSSCHNIEKIIIPPSVEIISEKAFFKSKIKEMVIPPTVKCLSQSSFGSCLDLKKIEIQGPITSIPQYCFSSCKSLEEIVFPPSLEKIDKFAFCNCNSLKTINLPKSLKEINSYAFSSSLNLEKVVIPDSVKLLGDGAFSCCSNLKAVKLSSSLTNVSKSTFSKCINLENIIMSSNIEIIEECAFEHCDSLKEIEIPDSVKKIGRAAFYYCKNLHKIKLSTNLDRIGHITFVGCESLEEIEIPYGVKKIEEFTFQFCENLKKVILPNTVTELKDGCFSSCSNLKEIVIPYGVKSIAKQAFFACKSLEKIEFPTSLKEIDYATFSSCSNLKEITIPFSVKKIPIACFNNSNLESIQLADFPQLHQRGIKEKHDLRNAYFNKETSSILLLKDEKNIDGYEKVDYKWCIETLDKCDFQTAVITSIILKREDYEKLNRIRYVIPSLVKDISKNNYQEISNNLKNNKEFERMIKYIKGDFFLFDHNLENEYYDLFKLAYSLGAFNDNQIDRQKATEFIINCFDKEIFDFSNIHGSFESMKLNKFNKEWQEFIMDKKNFKELIVLEKEQTGYISRIFNSFKEIKEYGRSNRGDQHYRKVTINMCKEYLARVHFRGVDDSNIDISETIGHYTRNQESFDEAVEIRKNYIDLKEKGKIRDSIIKDVKAILDNLNEISNNKFTYEFLNKLDPQNYVLGKYCSCCAHLEGMGRGIMKASILHPDCQNLVIKDEKGNIIAKSTLYVNRKQGYGLFNNVEINNNITSDSIKKQIYEKYIEAIETFVRAYNEENLNNPLKQINVGMHLNDLAKQIRERHSSGSILEGVNFSNFEGYNGDWQNEQYVIWSNEKERKNVKK